MIISKDYVTNDFEWCHSKKNTCTEKEAKFGSIYIQADDSIIFMMI